MLTVTPTALPEVLMLEPQVFGDERGFFLESWNQRRFDEACGQEVRFVQDNHSRSERGVLRGMHYQIGQPQGKLVRVVTGRVFCAAVDMRRSSPRLGQWAGVELSEDKHRLLWIPPGFAHGFLVLSQQSDFLYKTTDYYAPQHERALAWDDPHVAIRWPLQGLDGGPHLSAKDNCALAWTDCELFD